MAVVESISVSAGGKGNKESVHHLPVTFAKVGHFFSAFCMVGSILGHAAADRKEKHFKDLPYLKIKPTLKPIFQAIWAEIGQMLLLLISTEGGRGWLRKVTLHAQARHKHEIHLAASISLPSQLLQHKQG